MVAKERLSLEEKTYPLLSMIHRKTAAVRSPGVGVAIDELECVHFRGMVPGVAVRCFSLAQLRQLFPVKPGAQFWIFERFFVKLSGADSKVFGADGSVGVEFIKLDRKPGETHICKWRQREISGIRCGRKRRLFWCGGNSLCIELTFFCHTCKKLR